MRDNPIKQVKGYICLGFIPLDPNFSPITREHRVLWRMMWVEGGHVFSPPFQKELSTWPLFSRPNLSYLKGMWNSISLATKTLHLIVMSHSMMVQRKDTHWKLCHEPQSLDPWVSYFWIWGRQWGSQKLKNLLNFLGAGSPSWSNYPFSN